jgi:hypothetical protein
MRTTEGGQRWEGSAYDMLRSTYCLTTSVVDDEVAIRAGEANTNRWERGSGEWQ